MSVQNQTYEPVGDGLSKDFGKRLEQFMRVSGLGPRPLGRLVGVSPHRVREWRRGVVPSGRYLFRLLMVAEAVGLRGILMRRKQGWGPSTVGEYGEFDGHWALPGGEFHALLIPREDIGPDLELG